MKDFDEQVYRESCAMLRASGDTITEVLNMANENKKRRVGRRAIIAAATAVVLALALGVTALAYSGIVRSWSGSTNTADAYLSLPTAEQARADAGYVPVLIERFENGYTFDKGYLVENRLEEELNGPLVEAFKSFDFVYEKDGDYVQLDQEKYAADTGAIGDVIATVDGIELRYFSFRSRGVPGDYELTEQDKLDEANGVVFSYGVESGPEKIQDLFWQVGDMHYTLSQVDGALTPDALVDMAKEIIAAS